jgi:DNA end-binding protein Ku
MARPIWKGTISFGLVNVPIALYPAERRSDLHFSLLDSRDKAQVRYQRVNEVTGEEVPWDEVVKAYEYQDGDFVVIEDEEFKRVAVEATQTVEIEAFVDEDEIEYVYFDKPYYLVPGKKGEKAYVLMRETLRRAHTVGIAKVVIRARQYLAALIPEGNALILDLLRYKHEIRDISEYEIPDKTIEEYNISERELQMAEKLVETMTTKWEPESFHDEYRDALMQYIERKAKAGETAVAAEPEAPAPEEKKGEIIDIMDLLKKSVQQKAEQRPKKTASGGKKTGSSRK